MDKSAILATNANRSSLLALTIGLMVFVGACAPPVSPSPTVRFQPEGRGIVDSVPSAPSRGCSAGSGAASVTGPPGTESFPTGAGVHDVDIRWQGVSRTARLGVPANSTGARPLLVSLHPFTQGPAEWEEYSGLADAAMARGYVVLSPLGSDPGPRWAVPGGLAGESDDLGFISALMDRVEDDLCVDLNSEFAAGYSAGAAMAQALSCTMPWRFSAVAGSGGVNLTDTCADSPPTDVFVLHGSEDPIAPTGGSQIVFAPPMGLTVRTVVSTDAARAKCDLEPETDTPAPGVQAFVYPGCDSSHRVQYWEMIGAGHTWAGAAPFPFDLIVGPTATSFSADTVILDFFARG